MDLFGAITAIAALNGVKRDNRNPFALMPENIHNIKIKHKEKTVNIPKTAENLFNNPSFICTDFKKFWKNVEKDPKGNIIDIAKEFGTEIVYL